MIRGVHKVVAISLLLIGCGANKQANSPGEVQYFEDTHGFTVEGGAIRLKAVRDNVEAMKLHVASQRLGPLRAYWRDDSHPELLRMHSVLHQSAAGILDTGEVFDWTQKNRPRRAGKIQEPNFLLYFLAVKGKFHVFGAKDVTKDQVILKSLLKSSTSGTVRSNAFNVLVEMGVRIHEDELPSVGSEEARASMRQRVRELLSVDGDVYRLALQHIATGNHDDFDWALGFLRWLGRAKEIPFIASELDAMRSRAQGDDEHMHLRIDQLRDLLAGLRRDYDV